MTSEGDCRTLATSENSTFGHENFVSEHSPSSHPDVIGHPVIMSQPSSTPVQKNTPWAYTPSGPAPVKRGDYRGSVTSVYTEVNTRRGSDAASVSGYTGSRDWSRNLFDAFREIKSSLNKCSSLKKFCCECLHVPCMMCDIAQSLGDKPYLPFIPGTGAAIRFKVRILGGIQGSIADDCLVSSCCCPCAVCQMYRELEDIGLGPI